MYRLKFVLLFRRILIYSLVLAAGIHFAAAQSATGDQINLIVRVDDMGCSHATNTGILETFEKGIATSVEVMVPTPWYPEAIAMLKKRPDIDVGIHLTLTSEWTNIKWRPVTDVPSIVDDHGYFFPMVWPNSNMPKNSSILEGQWSLEDIEKELRAQIEIIQKDLPDVSHMSAHMGCLSMNEETKTLFEKLGAEYALDIYPEDYQVKRLPLRWDNTMTPEQRIELFVEAIDSLTPGNWMFVEHPAHSMPEQQAIGHPTYNHVAFDRDAVLHVLTSDAVKNAISKKNVHLISYADLEK